MGTRRFLQGASQCHPGDGSAAHSAAPEPTGSHCGPTIRFNSSKFCSAAHSAVLKPTGSHCGPTSRLNSGQLGRVSFAGVRNFIGQKSTLASPA